MTMFNEKRLCFTFVMIKLELVSLEVWGGLFLFEMNPGVSKFVFGIPYSTWIPFIFFYMWLTESDFSEWRYKDVGGKPSIS